MNEIVKMFGRPFMGIAMLAAVAGLFYFGMRHINTLVADASRVASAERDNFWRSVIAAENAAAARKLADQKEAALAAEAQAQAEIAALTRQLEDIEADNAQIPDNHCGIDRDRILLLNRQTGNYQNNISATGIAADCERGMCTTGRAATPRYNRTGGNAILEPRPSGAHHL